MSQLKAIGTNPVVFFTRDGRLIDVPISAIFFDGTTVGTTWPAADTGTERLLGWLETLAKRGDLKPDAEPVAPPPTNACTITAFAAGPSGNDIEVVIEPSGVGPAGTVDITVSRIETYTDITLTALDLLLGTAAVPGPSTGLLRVRTNAGGVADRVIGPVVFAAGPPATWTIADTDPAASPVVLEAKRTSPASGFDAADFTVEVSNIQPGVGGAEQTFTLAVTWSHKVEAVAAPAGGALPAGLAALRYLVTITAPGGFKVPAPTTIKLSGGHDPVAPVNAGATLLAND